MGDRGEGAHKRTAVRRDHHRMKPITQTLKLLRRVAKSADQTLRRKMATFEGGQFVVLVKALRQDRSGRIQEVVEVVGSPNLRISTETDLTGLFQNKEYMSGKEKNIDGNRCYNSHCWHESEDAENGTDDQPSEKTHTPLANTSSLLYYSGSQNSFLDIEGFPDAELSLEEWEGKQSVTEFSSSSSKDIANFCDVK